MQQISPWVARYWDLIPKDKPVLDLAAGKGRHSLFLLEKGYKVAAVDIRTEALEALPATSDFTVVTADLENDLWPFSHAHFSGIIGVNYLWRDNFETMLKSLSAGGVLLYDTFAVGNERFGKPSNPNFLLRPEELKNLCAELEILHYAHGEVTDPHPAVRQSIAARMPL
ncbi:MAG: methyltransferase domain-containing protein [Proteobacteria bacterium]|nr:methyltransferase domain-containing protein [Pseudomonadota bacterium]